MRCSDFAYFQLSQWADVRHLNMYRDAVECVSITATNEFDTIYVVRKRQASRRSGRLPEYESPNTTTVEYFDFVAGALGESVTILPRTTARCRYD